MHLLRRLQEQAAEFAPVRSALGETWHRSAEEEELCTALQSKPRARQGWCVPNAIQGHAAEELPALPPSCLCQQAWVQELQRAWHSPAASQGSTNTAPREENTRFYLFILKQLMLFIKPSDGQAHVSAEGSQLLLGREARRLQFCLLSAFSCFGCSFN